jgi:hypothetical protein
MLVFNTSFGRRLMKERRLGEAGKKTKNPAGEKSCAVSSTIVGLPSLIFSL